jgi:uncharacterized membrane protein YgcG
MAKTPKNDSKKTETKKVETKVEAPQPKKAPAPPAYLQFQGGFQGGNNKGGVKGSGGRPSGGGSSIRRTAPGGGK